MTETTCWSIAVHGGAGSMTPELLDEAQQAACHAGLAAALNSGRTVLESGGSALDAVEAAVIVLEDDPLFNAGRGSVFTHEGRNEMDAAIMEGGERKAGAVSGLDTTKNPVRAARAVMEHTPHVLLGGSGANRFSAESGIEQAPPEWFATDERRRQWEEFSAKGTGWFDAGLKYGTVGAVARDTSGHLAAATSTGGLTGKRWGRVGDSPLIGAGTYADDRSCAVSATGTGEVFIRTAAAHEIGVRMRLAHENVQVAAEGVIAEVGSLGGEGGVIVVGADGSATYAFNTSGMFRGRAASDGLFETAIFAES